MQKFSGTVHSTDFPITREVFQRLQLLLDSISCIHKILRQFITHGHISQFLEAEEKRFRNGKSDCLDSIKAGLLMSDAIIKFHIKKDGYI